MTCNNYPSYVVSNKTKSYSKVKTQRTLWRHSYDLTIKMDMKLNPPPPHISYYLHGTPSVLCVVSLLLISSCQWLLFSPLLTKSLFVKSGVTILLLLQVLNTPCDPWRRGRSTTTTWPSCRTSAQRTWARRASLSTSPSSLASPAFPLFRPLHRSPSDPYIGLPQTLT